MSMIMSNCHRDNFVSSLPGRNNPNKEAHLARLLNEAKAQAWDLDLYMRQMLQMSATGGGSGLSSALMREKETQLTACQRKVNLMERLLTGLQLLGKSGREIDDS